MEGTVLPRNDCMNSHTISQHRAGTTQARYDTCGGGGEMGRVTGPAPHRQGTTPGGGGWEGVSEAHGRRMGQG